MRGNEAMEARHQPARCHRRHDADGELVGGRRTEFLQCPFDRLELGPHQLQQARSFGSKVDAPRSTNKHTLAQPVFQSADLVAECAGGEVHVAGRQR